MHFVWVLMYLARKYQLRTLFLRLLLEIGTAILRGHPSHAILTELWCGESRSYIFKHQGEQKYWQNEISVSKCTTTCSRIRVRGENCKQGSSMNQVRRPATEIVTALLERDFLCWRWKKLPVVLFDLARMIFLGDLLSFLSLAACKLGCVDDT